MSLQLRVHGILVALPCLALLALGACDKPNAPAGSPTSGVPAPALTQKNAQEHDAAHAGHHAHDDDHDHDKQHDHGSGHAHSHDGTNGLGAGSSAAAHAAATTAAAYACPMHPEVTRAEPAKCSKCGMDLISTKPAALPAVTVTTTPSKPKAGQKTRLVFEIMGDGARLTSFDVVHDKKLHLIMVTPDLAWFAHEHPEQQTDGTFALDFTFPHGGVFRLFSDFKASTRAPAVVPVDVQVEGVAPAPQPLNPSDLAKARAVGSYAVRLTTPPPPAGVSATLKFLVARDGKPVTDLSPYLGALGHLVILHADGKTFLHSHPEETGPHDDSGQAPHAHTAVAPGEVAFGTRFPKPGLYKLWAQFLHAGQTVIADFVVEVR